jgi:hypothetical protein
MTSTASRASAQAESCRFKIGAIVLVVDAIDRDVYDVLRFVGRVGEVLRHGTRNGDSTFADAMFVGFCDGSEMMFWPEELTLP